MIVGLAYLLGVMVLRISGEEDIGTQPEWCNDGYMGVFCENRCPFPYYGDQCKQKCKCRREECDHVTGCPPPADTCPVGFIGTYCETSCKYPNYGEGCQQKCMCSKLRCNSSTGCVVKTNLKSAGLQIRKDTTSAQNTINGSFEAQQEYSTRIQAYNIKKTHGYIQGISELNQNWNV
uniref:Multiple epidermal growth factor-like domains protein 10 n=1 Tax=Crassostrea virginica TaxID=6565 RepID=A0A8B8AIU0_CRAVI|nr:multiple epidermal growth factor-like domains protein 10 [Crassostrea virginica]